MNSTRQPTSFLPPIAAIALVAACGGVDPVDECSPVDCDALEAVCGVEPDGCGGEIFCGECEDGRICEAGVCVPDPDEGSRSFLFAIAKAKLSDPLPMQQRGRDAVEMIGNAVLAGEDFEVALLREEVIALDDYLADPYPFSVTREIFLAELFDYSQSISEEDVIVIYTHSHGIRSIPGTRLGGLLLDDPLDSDEWDWMRWAGYAEALMELPAKTVVVLTMACFSGGLVTYLENVPAVRNRWEDRVSEGRDFVVITSQNATTLSNPRLIEGTVINPFTYAVTKAFEGAADGHRREGEDEAEPDGVITLQELIEYVVDETRSHTGPNDPDNDPDPQVTGSYRPDTVIFDLGRFTPSLSPSPS